MFDGSNRQHYECIEPVVFDDPKILILQSMPSVDSEAAGFPFMDTSNRFWPLMSSLYHMPVETIEQRKELCKKNHLAIWSVVKSCMRYLSEEDTMDDIVLNNIQAFLDKYPTIERIVCISHETDRLLKEADYNAASISSYVPSTSAADLWYDSVEKLTPKWAQALGIALPEY